MDKSRLVLNLPALQEPLLPFLSAATKILLADRPFSVENGTDEDALEDGALSEEQGELVQKETESQILGDENASGVPDGESANLGDESKVPDSESANPDDGSRVPDGESETVVSDTKGAVPDVETERGAHDDETECSVHDNVSDENPEEEVKAPDKEHEDEVEPSTESANLNRNTDTNALEVELDTVETNSPGKKSEAEVVHDIPDTEEENSLIGAQDADTNSEMEVIDNAQSSEMKDGTVENNVKLIGVNNDNESSENNRTDDNDTDNDKVRVQEEAVEGSDLGMGSS